MAMLMSPGDDDHNRAIRGAALWSWGHGEGPIQEGLGSLDRPSGGGVTHTPSGVGVQWPSLRADSGLCCCREDGHELSSSWS